MWLKWMWMRGWQAHYVLGMDIGVKDSTESSVEDRMSLRHEFEGQYMTPGG